MNFLIAHTAHLSESAFESDEVLLDSVMFRLIQISENSSRLTENFKVLHRQIPWTAMRGLRNRIVHEYGDVDLHIVWETVTQDIPHLLQMLSSI